MREPLKHFIATAQRLAGAHDLSWNLACDEAGRISNSERWNLARLSNSTTPVWLSDFGIPANLIAARDRLKEPGADPAPTVLPPLWQDFLKASTLDLLITRQQSAHSFYRFSRMIKVLALACQREAPDEIVAEDVRLAYNISLLTGDGELARTFPGFIATRIDNLHIADRPNLRSQCTPFNRVDTLASQSKVDGANLVNNSWKSRGKTAVLKELHARRDEFKLPDSASFWELTRIVFTEKPRSVHDLQIFAACRAHIITGMRAAELALLPRDWEVWHAWVDYDGRSAAEKGGVARSLQIRHFAGKQNSAAKQLETRNLVPKLHDVPELFQEIILDTFHEVERVTEPMRETLRNQYATGRLLPMFSADEIVLATEIFKYIYGDVEISKFATPDYLISAYIYGDCPTGMSGEYESFDLRLLDEIEKFHKKSIGSFLEKSGKKFLHGSYLSDPVKAYWGDKRSKLSSDLFVDSKGKRIGDVRGRDWSDTFLRVSEVESVLKTSGWYDKIFQPGLIITGRKAMLPHDFLFLAGIDALGGRREAKTIDVRKLFAIRRFHIGEVSSATGERKDTRSRSIFNRYCRTDEAKQMSLRMHELRHLQNTELFRKGVSDTIIAKRFNRTNSQQSTVYDHRSLHERLSHIDVEQDVLDYLKSKAALTYKLIKGGFVSGPIVDQFSAIQKGEGDQAAFDFLIAEADGLHATPYGLCLNSFTVDPCPKHLECFSGCIHLGRTDIPEEQERLQILYDQTAIVVEKIEGSPGEAVGRANQLRHGRQRLAAIEKALSTRPGHIVFPDGQDLSRPISEAKGCSVFDAEMPVFLPVPIREDDNG